ncbi:MAG TPA: PAS domain S-box protein [Candidatus Binatia bacterium]|nr:PAS domain S-box protein [Candidatus Binatia bacterium]
MITPEPSRAGAAPERSFDALSPLDDRVFRRIVEGARDYAIFLLSPEGVIRTWNLGAERIKGYAPSEIIGQHFSRFYPQEANDRGWPMRELEIAKAEGRFEDEGWRLRKDGSRFWANVVITAIYDDSGELAGFSKITRDLSERRRHEESLRESEERFRLLVEGVSDYAIVFLNPEGYVSSWNVGARRIQGYGADEIIGRHFSLFFPAEAKSAGAPQRLLDQARATDRVEDDGWRVRRDGSRFWANEVITALYDHEGSLRGYAKVTQDMTQRRKIEVLEETARRVNEFLAMLAHELRNPLAPIRNAVGLMRAKRIDDPTLQWSRDVIERQTAHLSRLVDDLLDVSRITSGRLTLQRERLDLAVVFERAVEASRPLIEGRRQALEVRLPETPLWVDGDLIRLAQIVLNLLNNAAKYTPAGGNIWLSGALEAGRAVIRVRDSGVGISADLKTRIFDLFTQGARTLDRSDGGLGIGLTLVERLAALHGGTVEVVSAGANQGSEFIVRLPSAATPREAPSAPGAAGSAASRAVRRRVLVVDDNRDSTETMSMLLGVWGHDTRSANDGPSALTIAAAFQPEVVLLDIGLPGMDGYEVARRMHELPGLRSTVLIAMTGYGQEEDRLRSRSAGFARHLVKPADPGALRQLLEALPE